MNCLNQIIHLVFAIAVFISFPLSGHAADGITLDNSGRPKGGTPPGKMKTSDWSDLEELRRTWDGAKVRIPLETGLLKATMKSLGAVPKGKKFPVIIYMHGCNGFWFGTDRRVDFLASLGFAVIAPNSFARKKVPTSCEPLKHSGSLYRPTLFMRHYEATHAIEAARTLSWVDNENIVLMGLSEGGIATATYFDESVKARIIEGWTCHATWSEYHGLNAPVNEPVLSLVSKKDPWFKHPDLQGDCGEFMLNDQSESVVFDSGSLLYRHELLEFEEAKKIVEAFLEKHIGQ